MTNVMLIVRRELSSHFTTLTGYVVAAVMLAICGLLFNTVALGGSDKYSEEVLRMFFYFMSGTVMVGAIFLSMRLLAEERQNGTLTVLYTSPIADWQIVVGKYLSALLFLALIVGLSLYMPALIFVNGKVSLGHIFAGTLGLLMLGSASVAIGTFGSSVTRSQVVAAAVSGGIIVALLLMWKLAKIANPPLDDIFGAMSLFDKHFQPAMKGIVNLRDIVFYLSVTFFFLLATTKIIEARRWR